MNQNIWGPNFWFCLHTITFNYPLEPTKEDKLNYYNFFYHLGRVLPCSYCQKNYRRNFKEMPIKLNNRKDLVYWLIDFHNEVNGKEGKRHYTYSEIIKEYEKKFGKEIKLDEEENEKCFDLECHKIKINWQFFIGLLIGIIIGVLLVLIFKRKL